MPRIKDISDWSVDQKYSVEKGNSLFHFMWEIPTFRGVTVSTGDEHQQSETLSILLNI